MSTPSAARSTRRAVGLGRIAASGALWAVATIAIAQTGLAPASPSAPASSADLPGRVRPTPKVTSPADAQRSLNLDNPRPEGRVTPQIKIPLGKRKDDAPVLQRRPTDTTGSSIPPNGTIGDAAAKCEAQRDPGDRGKCLAAPAR